MNETSVGGSVMADGTMANVEPLNTRVAVVFAVGMALGLIIGVLATMLATGRSVSASPPIQPTGAVASVQERWFIWDGSAPITGQTFRSDAECEKVRQALVADAARATEDALKQLPPMSIHQIQGLGYNPADRIQEQFDHVQRAYCHRNDE